MSRFQDVYGGPPAVTALAPGRVHLLGEHDERHEGCVLPIAVGPSTQVSLAVNPAERAAFVVHVEGQPAPFESAGLDDGDALSAAPPEVRRVIGCLQEVRAQGEVVPPLFIHVRSDLPADAGLASRTAAEIATLRALRGLLGVPFDDLSIAKLAQRVEAACASGAGRLVDAMACSLADTRRALFLDTRSRQRQLVPLPEGTAVLVLDAGIARSSVDPSMAQRQAECDAAAQALGVGSLRDAYARPQAGEALEALPSPPRERARHVVTETARVLRAAEGVSAREFGALINESHASLRDDFGASAPAVDRLVRLLQSHPAVFGARFTGHPCGSTCVALCQADALRDVGEAVLRDHRAAGMPGRVLSPLSPPAP